MAKFNFYLRDKSKNGETPIILYVSYNSLRVKYPTQTSIHPKYWNEVDMVVRNVKDFPQAKAINNHLKHLSTVAENVLYEKEVGLRRFPTKHEFIEALDNGLGRSEEVQDEASLDFLSWYNRFIEESRTGARLNEGKQFDKRSIQKYEATYRYLEEFNKLFYLTFDNINADFHSKFTEFFNKKGFKLNTVGKHIQVLKTFLNYALEKGVNVNLYFKSRRFTSYKEESFSIYLNEKTLSDINNLDLSKTPNLERQRDLFMVGCWTGLRFADLEKIGRSNISGDFMTVETQKTGETVIIPIHPVVKAIYQKYSKETDSGFPAAISNQKMNEYLKIICKKVNSIKDKKIVTKFTKGGEKIEEEKLLPDLITTHTARRSFATNLYLSGFPSISIMKITGHRTEKAFLKYIKITPEENAKKLLEHWKKL